MTQNRIDDFIMSTSLLVYLAVCTLVPYKVLSVEFWYVGVTRALAYVAGHIAAITSSSHCYLSADSIVTPGVLVVAVVAAIVLKLRGVLTFADHAWPYLKSFAVSFMAGHIAALIYAAVATTVLGMLFRSTSSDDLQLKGIAALSKAEGEVRREGQ